MQLLQNGKQQFIDQNGAPLVGGQVFHYMPGTTTPATTYKDQAGQSANANPIQLDSRGQAVIWGTGTLRQVVKDAGGNLVWDQVVAAPDILGQVSSPIGSSLVGFLQAGAGAVLRWVQDKLRLTIDVQDFGVVGDGTADDTTGLNSALAAAKATSRRLRWNGATCKVAGNLPNLHAVTHVGPGTVARGGNTFAVSGSASCSLYVSTTGSATNDGLTVDTPMLSLQNAFNAIANYGPVVTQKFLVYLAAGTYPAPTPITLYTPSLQQIEVYGADVGGSRNVPTTIIDGAGGATYSHGIYAQGWGVRLKVQDVKLINFNNGGGNAADRTRGGVVFDRGADGWTKNVHVTAASWFGIYGTSAQACLVESGILDGCRIGVNTDHTRCTVGWNALVASSARPLIKNSTEQGVSWTNGTQGHVDYTDFLSNAVALHLEGGSRCDAVSSDFKLNTVAVECYPGGFFGNNPSAPCTFNVGTANANTADIKSYSGGGDYNGLLINSTSEAEVDRYRGNMTITGDTDDHVIYTSTAIPSGFFKDSRQRLRFVVYGVVTSASVPPILKTTVAGVPLASMTMPANAVPGQGFKLEIEAFSNGTGNHYVAQKLSCGTATLDRISSGAYNFAFTDGAKSIVFSGALQAAGDTVVINRIAIFAAG